MKANLQRGAVMIEVMVAILIFSFAVLGLFGMQSVALKNTAQSNYRAAAVYLASQLVATAQGDIKHLADYQYTAGSTNTKVDPWLAEVRAVLPAAQATVSSTMETAPSTNGVLSVTVSWLAPGDTVRHQHTVSTYVSY